MRAGLLGLALLLAALGWLAWDGYFAPAHEPVRVLNTERTTPPPPPVMPAPAAMAPPPVVAAPAEPAGPPAPPPTAQPVADPIAAFRRAVEEAQARQATQGPMPATSGVPLTLPEAIEAARRAQQAGSSAQPAPGAAINPFGR